MTHVAGNATHLRSCALSGGAGPGDVYRYDGAAFVCDSSLSRCEAETAQNRRNIQLLFLQQATYNNIVFGAAVNGFYDSFEDDSGIDSQRLVGRYAEGSGCLVSTADPGSATTPYLTAHCVNRGDLRGACASWRQDAGATGHFEAEARSFTVGEQTTSEAGGSKTGFPAVGHGLPPGAIVRFEGFANSAFNGIHTVDSSSSPDRIIIAVAYTSEVISAYCKHYHVLRLGAGQDCPEVGVGSVVRLEGREDVYVLGIDQESHGAGNGKTTLSAAVGSGVVIGIFGAAVENGRITPAYTCQNSPSVAAALTPGTRPPARQLHCEIVHAPTRKYYAIGGVRHDTGLYINECWEYDIDGDAWREVTLSGDTPGYSRHHSAAYIPKTGKYLVMGCDLNPDGSVRNTRLWMAWFDPLALSWTNITPANYPTLWQRAGGAYDPVSECFWLFGGDTTAGAGSGESNELWRYDIAANTWTQHGLAGGPPIRARMSIIYERSHSLLMFGGVGYGGVFLGDLWRYDIATDTWTQLNPNGSVIPLANVKHCYEPVNGRWYIWGGMTTGSVYNPYLYCYDVPTNTWSQLTTSDSLYGSHCSRSAITILDGTMYCFGGSMPTVENSVKAVHLYDPSASRAWACATTNTLSALEIGAATVAMVAEVSQRLPAGAGAYYALSWDQGSTWWVFSNGEWRGIVRNEQGAWQVNMTFGWVTTSSSDACLAIEQATDNPANLMTAEDLVVITEAQWDALSVQCMPSETLNLAVILAAGDGGLPALHAWTFDRIGGLDVQSAPVPVNSGASTASASFLVKGGAEGFSYYVAADACHTQWVPLPGTAKTATMAGGVEFWASEKVSLPTGCSDMVIRVRGKHPSELHGWAASWNA